MKDSLLVLAILVFAIGISRGKVVNLHGTVGEENVGCEFRIVYKRMKVDVQKSRIKCSKPTKMFEVDEIVIGNDEIEVTVSFKVSKKGKGRIMKAKIQKNSGDVFNLKTDNEIMPTVDELGLPDDWVNVTDMRDLDGEGNTTKMTRVNHGYQCTTNGWDGFQWCLCRPGQKVGGIKSWHDNGKEDRRWELRCENIPGFSPTSHHTTSENHWDGTVHWDGFKDNSFLVGMTSHHHNKHEDRKFKFMTSRSDLWYLSGPCRGWYFVNHYDGELHINTEHDEVIVGLHSWHDNHKEDRRWQAVICKLKSKCSAAGEMKVDHTKVKFSNARPEYAYFDDIDASQSASDITKKIKFTQSQLRTMSETESYSRTHGHTFNVGFSITKKIGLDVKFFEAGGEVTFSAGYEYSYSTTHTQSKTTSFEEGRQGSSEWTVTCKAGYICKTHVKIAKVTATAPYALTAGSCTENGFVTIESSYAGSITQVDTPVKPPTQCQDDGRFAASCPGWATWACQGRYEAFMRQYCPKSCKICI